MNNTTNNTNNNTAKVIIPTTTVRKEFQNKFLDINMAVHEAMVRRAIKPLYSWSPVYKVINVEGFGVAESIMEAEIQAKIEYVIGGNSPVARSFEVETAARELDVVQYDSNGTPSFRRVVTGANKQYGYIDSLTLVRFPRDTKNMGEETVKTLTERVLSEGLSIVDGNVVFGQIEGGQRLNPFVWSPSNERSGQIIFTSLSADEAWDKLEAIGGGAMDRKLSGEVNLAKFKKIASRLGLFATPATEFVKVGNANNGLLVVDTELEGADDFDNICREALKKIGVVIDKNQWDGAAFFSNSLALEGLKNLGVKGATANRALMFAFQLRIAQVYAKVFGEALHQSVINKIAKFITTELDKEALVNGKRRYRIYGNKNNITMILDANAAKLIDLEQDAQEDGMQVFLLDIAKASSSRTSTQMIMKFALMDPAKTEKFMKKKAAADCVNYADNVGAGSINLLDDNINVWQTLLSVAKEMPTGSKTAMDIYTDENIMCRLLADVSKKHESAYKKCAVEIASSFERALFDSTFLLTDGKIDSLLKADNRGAIECFSNDILDMYTEEIEAIEGNVNLTAEQKKRLLDKLLTASIIKYPTPGTEEIALVRFLTAQEVRERITEWINSCLIDAPTAQVVWNYFIYTSYGVIKIAADNALKHKLAGMDTDYDGVVVILEEELNSILLDVYAKRTEALEETTGLVAPHTGAIPFIDHSKDATNFFVVGEGGDSIANTLYGDDVNVGW